MKMAESSLLKGRKHCGERRNCSLRAIFPFPAETLKRVLVWERVKRITISSDLVACLKRFRLWGITLSSHHECIAQLFIKRENHGLEQIKSISEQSKYTSADDDFFF